MSQLTSAIPGTDTDLDVASYVWNVWWAKQALETSASIFRSDEVIIPFGVDLRVHTYGPLLPLLAYPFTFFLGIVGAYNLVLVVMFFLNGLAAYWVIRAEVKSTLPALIAATWAMLAPQVLFHFRVGRPALGCIWIVIAAILSLRALIEKPGPLPATLLALSLLLALFADLQVVLFSVLWLGLYVAANWKRVITRPVLVALSAVAAVTVLPFLLVFYPALSDRSYSLPSLDDIAAYSLSAWHYLTPSAIPHIYGYELLGAALASAFLFRRKGSHRYWLVSVGVLAVLSLGPYLKPSHFPLPSHYWGIFGLRFFIFAPHTGS